MITVSGLPDVSLMDTLVNITLQGAEPGSHLTLRLSTQDEAQVTWQSQARYQTDPEVGKMKLSRAQPESGTYQRAHPMGLFWSMRSNAGPGKTFDKRGRSPLQYRFEVQHDDGKLVLEREFTRLVVDPDVKVETLEVSSGYGLAAEFYFKKTDDLKTRPLALIFGGSGGGIDFARRAAALLSSRGIPSLALAYFAYPGRPAQLAHIEVEYFQNAIRWLRDRVGNEKAFVTVMGQSRGGELSLILASLLRDEINQVVARVPSHIVWSQKAPSWIYQGASLKNISMLSIPEIVAEYELLRKTGEYIAHTPLFMKALTRLEEASQDAAIEVEKFNGKILLISGEDDQMWPSSWFSDRVMERMHAFGKGDQIRHLKYPNAGHSIPIPYFPSTVHDMVHAVEGMKYKNGGTDEGDAMAAEDSWMQIRRFIESI